LKRSILKLVWQEAGADFLLSIGQGIQEAQYDPIWRAALCSKKPQHLFEKWQRFEKFSHSSNRVCIQQNDENMAYFQRYAINGGAPTMPENFLICGLIIALLEGIGCLGLRCEMQIEGRAGFVIRENGQFKLPRNVEKLVTDSWQIGWQSFSSRINNPVSEIISLPIPHDQTTHIESLVRLLMADVSHQWKVGELAQETGQSKRSLQRKLGEAGLNFSSLIRNVRIHEACSLLAEGDAPVTSIAFCTGFSDSAHFSRDFRASMGMTPTDYRVGVQ
jgi:AraC-like DNA-binding protein